MKSSALEKIKLQGDFAKLDSSVVSCQQLIIALYKVPEMVKYEGLILFIFWLLQIRLNRVGTELLNLEMQKLFHVHIFYYFCDALRITSL